MFYAIKKSIIKSNIKKRQKKGYSRTESEMYTHPEGCPANMNNSYFFTAHSMEGESLFIRLGIRGDGLREVWTGWYKNGTFLENEKEFYAAQESCPLTVKCIEPEKTWGIQYSGTMRDVKAESRKTYSVTFDLVFSATEDIFDFLYDNDPATTAHAVASRKWSRNLFDEIQKNNQRHYEQCGELKGSYTVNGTDGSISLAAARDHSFGPRDWSYMDRHFWLLAVDEAGHCLNISMVDYPSVSGIWTGYTTMFGGVDTINEIKCFTDLNEAGHGDGQVHFEIALTNGRRFTVDTCRDAEAIYHFGDGAYWFTEGIGHFMIDGKPTRGTIEFGYNADESRWKKK